MVLTIITISFVIGLVTYSFMRMAAPQNEAEQQADDQAQIDYLKNLHK